MGIPSLSVWARLATRPRARATHSRVVRIRPRRLGARGMGVKGLPSVLEPYCARVTLDGRAGARAAVDAYSWLHKGAFACARELALGRAPWGRGDAPYVRYCVHRANMLRAHGIEPVIVFDGDGLPAKRREEGARRARRAEALERGRRAEAMGDGRAATMHYAGATDVTPEMARELIVALTREKFEFVVAPYEADAQIAWLARLPRDQGGVDLVFTEDSDLVAYGCPRVIFKLEKSGDAREFRLADMLAGSMTTPAKENKSVENATSTREGAVEGSKKRSGGSVLNFEGWSYDLFLDLCVLSGCDFLDNIPKLGIRKMYNLLNKHRNADDLFEALRADAKVKDSVPEGYEEEWRKARMIFKHAVVYDRNTQTLKNLSPLPADVEFDDLSFLGPLFDNDQARRIAEGEMNPISRRKFVQSPQKPSKQAEVKFGAKRKQMSEGTSAQRSFMMSFLAKVIPSPTRKKTNTTVAETAVPTLDSEDDDDLASIVVETHVERAGNAPEEKSFDRRDGTIEIDLIDDGVDRADEPKSWLKGAFARNTPPRRANALATLFSPKRERAHE